MDKAYKTLVEKSYSIKKIEHGFAFRTRDDRPCELTIEPCLEIYKGEVLLSARYNLSVSGYSYTYGQGMSEEGKKDVSEFAKMYEILEKRYRDQVEKGKKLMYDFVDSLRNG